MERNPRKRDYDDDDDEDSLDVYHYIAVSGGQEWGRHPEEASTAQPFVSREGQNPNREFFAYWQSLVNERTRLNRDLRIDLGAAERTPLEAAVEAANYTSIWPDKRRSEAPITDPVEEAIRHFEGVARFNARRAEEEAQDRAARVVQAERVRRREDRSFVMQPEGPTGGRPPRPLPRAPAAQGRLQPGLLRQAGGVVGARVPRAPEDEATGLIELLRVTPMNPDEARDAQSRFGQALKNPHLSAHKRAKYTKIYNVLSHMH